MAIELSRIQLDLYQAIEDNGGVECEQVPDIFFPEDFNSKQRGNNMMPRMAEQTARQICFRCPVISQCLKVGMYEEYGIYGGTTPAQRRRIKRENNY